MGVHKLKLKVLVAEEDKGLAAIIHSNLVNTGFDVMHARNGGEVLKKTHEFSPALVILDMLIPGMEGKEVLRMIKSTPTTCNIPLIALSEQAEEIDRIVALELGADDYVSKSFSPRELALRVRAILARGSIHQPKQMRLNTGVLKLDAESRMISVNGKPVDLSMLDFRLLTVLISARGGVVSREQLIESAWGAESGISPRTVDTQLRRLRRKLGVASNQIQTVRGFGYRLGE